MDRGKAKKAGNRLGQSACVARREDKASLVCKTDLDKKVSVEEKTVKRCRGMEPQWLESDYTNTHFSSSSRKYLINVS